MKENIRNIRRVCSEHAPKSGKYKGQDPSGFVGKYVKLGFPAKEGPLEHMWLKDVKISGWEGNQLQGILDNNPVYEVGYVCGDEIAFDVEEIEEVA